MRNHEASRAVIRVGDGRGFVVEDRSLDKYVVTAAHCLPERPDGQRLPPPHGFSYLADRTYPKLLAPLGGQPLVWCECLFVDPIADIAVLGAPDNQELSDEAAAYEALVEAATPLKVAEPPSKPSAKPSAHGFKLRPERVARECPAFLLSLSNKWFPCKVRHFPNGMFWIFAAANPIVGGMSGSPIIADDGTAIGIVCLGGGIGDAPHHEGGPNPRLMGNLPGWFLLAMHREAENRRPVAAPVPFRKPRR